MRIFISDVNDNKPVFAQTVYEVDVDEDADVGSTILTISANDEDEGRPRRRGSMMGRCRRLEFIEVEQKEHAAVCGPRQ